EPVHGSAPDIAGQGLANPIAMIGSFGMCLRYSFGLGQAADLVDRAIADVLASGTRTRDIAAKGGNAVGTKDMGDAIVGALKRLV
ncbi:MAG TPA: isocitrate/isopropylmalate family dehydrogenase, partial [Rhabdaerophilum sp.]|nr:isocitrate/isopropylmalate family dehydrogenase [Rhabdaerophilum sp.]